MATNITSWIPDVSPAAPGCPNQVLKSSILEICRDFCKHTQLWNNQALTAIDIVALTADYTLSSLLGDIAFIDAVLVDSNPIWPTTIEELNALFRYWRSTTETRPSRYVVEAADSIKLVYKPSEAVTAGLEVFVSLMPLRTATTVQDFIYRDHKEAIANGAIGKLLDIPNVPWSNIELAAVYTSRYEAARDTAKLMKFTGRAPTELIATRRANFFA